MIQRYSRRPVSHSLEIRGLSRSNLDHHPPPEEPDDYLSQHLHLHKLQEAESPSNSSEVSSLSSRSHCTTVSPAGTTRSWSGIHSYTGTGISTERSSVFSWGYDEFDKAASRQVQQMFEEIDEELFEGQSAGGQMRALQDECQQWASRFPHLRILGKQLVCPTDEGFQWFATPGTGTPTNLEEDKKDKEAKDKTSTELSVLGRKAVLSKVCTEAEQDTEERPRVIEAEGLVEEYLAYDCRDLDEELERECDGSGRGHCSLPPVSPYRCRRHAVLDLLFDDVWRDLVCSMEELVRRYWEGFVSDEEKNAMSFSPTSESQNPYRPLPNLPATLPRLGHTRMPHHTTNLQPQSAKAKGSKHKSRRKSKKQRKPSTSSRAPVGAAATVANHQNLNDLIVIQGIPLQQRNMGGLSDKAQEPEERSPHRPATSAVPLAKPHPRHTLEQSSSSLPRPAQSARRRNPPPRTLMPLAPNLTQSVPTAGSMDEVVRGTRLTTTGDRQSSPLMPLSRNNLLPPIGTPDGEHHKSGQHLRSGQRHRGSASRAHSAVMDEAGCTLPRDRLHLLDVYSRPNTTHTYRSDTPYRRSFTVLDNAGQGRSCRTTVGADSLGIGVTGVSLGISSSSFLDSFTHHTLAQSPVEDEEESNTQALPPVLLSPLATPARSHSRGGLASRGGRPGL